MHYATDLAGPRLELPRNPRVLRCVDDQAAVPAAGETPYVYILVRTDIPLAQQMVQASHAALEAGFAFNAPHEPAHLVMLAVSDAASLLEASAHLDRYAIEHKLFFEPDDDMGHSALATRPVHGAERRLLRGYPLHRPEGRADA